MAVGIIYQIQNLVNGWIYVGSTINERHRLARHLRHLKKGKHVNKALQFDFDEYGEENFEFSIVQRNVSEADLHLFESSAIVVSDLENNGRIYNTSKTPRISPAARQRLKDKRLRERNQEWLQKPYSPVRIKSGKLHPSFLTGSTHSGTSLSMPALPPRMPS
jgi:group I intron endonuclease